jgi:hypothetical protein
LVLALKQEEKEIAPWANFKVEGKLADVDSQNSIAYPLFGISNSEAFGVTASEVPQ